jgi:hypothetical protein
LEETTAMLAPSEERNTLKPTLGQYLASIRTDRKMTLREVEEATNKQVSNAYLSQIENDKIQKPSPNILQTHGDGGISYIKDKSGRHRTSRPYPDFRRTQSDNPGRSRDASVFAVHAQ